MHSLDVMPMSQAAPAPARVRFTGGRGPYARMMLRGALLQAITLGIYRFWLATEMRRFLWVNTEVDGDSLEYTGTAIELLLGFLIALAILVPIYVLFAIGSLELGIYSQLAGIVGFVALTCFGQYAFYRARRYRLSRTVYRGLRFHQDGSPWSYAARSILWGPLVLLTIGLAYPFAQASLERYKMRHTLYGDLRGSFVQKGWVLFWRGVPLWLALVGPLVVTMIFSAVSVDWAHVAGEAARRGARHMGTITQTDRPLAIASVAIGIAFGYLVIAAVVLYPVFQGIVWKWWLSGLRFGEIAVVTSLRKRQVYGVYFRFALLMLLLGVVVGVGFGAFAAYHQAFKPDLAATGMQIGLAVAGIMAYVVAMLAAWIGYQVAVKLALWRMIVNSLTLDGFAAIAAVRPQGQASSAVGEGLADALGAGGI